MVTPSGFSGTLVNEWVNIVTPGVYPLLDPLADLDIGKHACAYELGADPGCTPFKGIVWNPTEERNEFTADSLWPPCMTAQIVWPAIAFPQHDVQINSGYFGAGNCLNSAGVYYDAFVPNQACADKCAVDGAAILCQTPNDQSIIYGPAQYRRVYQADFNASYICHRTDTYLRPEFTATVNRSQAAGPDAVDARLSFDVYCRRGWQFFPPCNGDIILNLSCAVSDTPPTNPPDGNYFCIDYRCGPRQDDVAEGGSICSQHKCTAHEGTVWPHLFAYPPGENFTATIRLYLVPDAYYKPLDGYSYQGAKPSKPMTWIVSKATATTAGTGYQVGQFFVVDFDQAWLGVTGGGEVNIALPATEPECGFPVTWLDDYGYEPQQPVINGPKFFYQRLRVEEVDQNGGILRLSVVPWYMTPEYRKNACGVEITNKAQKTKFFPAYTRVICHPNSVDIGGTGYQIGNSITFTPLSPNVEVYADAIAEVVDVDDDGAVLDWEIKGSDIWRYGFGLGNPTCDIYGQDDERGAYKWTGKYLCELHWSGVGVPVRAAIPTYDAFLLVETWANAGALTAMNVSVMRMPCRTTISVVVGQYLYETAGFVADSEDPDASAFTKGLKLCPPYPKCVGGGAQITPVIGTDGGNESAIGGPLAAGHVKSNGAYYAFVDKSHVAPTLPTAIPDIGSGTGGVIGQFTFDSVLNFPKPGYADGQKHLPSATRFAYYPVTAATVAAGGTGYTVGQEFDVQPVGGTAYSRAWTKTGGDDPDAVANGSWYAGELARTDANGYLAVSNYTERYSVCRLRVSAVNAQGAITALEVVHGGMMFRPVWANGVRHPDVFVYVGSDTGFGAAATVTIDTNKTSQTFGEVTACQIVAIPIEQAVDPLHSTPGNPVAIPLGGRDYANPPSGQMWEIGNITVGGGWIGGPSMMCKIDPHNFVRNYYHPSDSPWDLIDGSHPPFHRRAEGCTLDECYHSLLNRSYPLYRIWNNFNINFPPGLNTQNRIEQWWEGCALDAPNSYSPFPITPRAVDGRPPNSYGLYRAKGKRTDVFLPNPTPDPTDPNLPICGRRIGDQEGYDGLPSAGPGDFVVVEWGFSVGLSAVIPTYPNCPDHENGRTAE